MTGKLHTDTPHNIDTKIFEIHYSFIQQYIKRITIKV